MSHHLSRYRVIIIILGIGFFTWTGSLTREFGKESYMNVNQQISGEPIPLSPTVTRNYNTITGKIIDGPGVKNREKRAQRLGENDEFIYGWIYDITYPTSKDRLRSQSRSKDISLIVENQKYQQYSNDFASLQQEFIDTNIVLSPDRDLGINFTHAKTFVGDKTRIIQTANLNRTSFLENREHFFLGTDEHIRQNLIDLFALDMKVIADRENHTIDYQNLISEFSPNLVVCPLNCRQIIESLLTHATESIRISAQYITDDKILDILRAQTDKDIHIRTNDFDTNRSLIRFLGKENITFESKKIYNHDKMIIIDNKIMLIGSMNLSDNALDHNREIGIITTDQTLINPQDKLFQKL